jgi:lipopolysaccharide/colanic/teichoic acid biosynthesis glycosyltransferase
MASENDPRVTKIGRFMRDTRLDEFPQLVNVILGQMSLVGPRPERPYFVKHHKALMEIRLSIRPGLTGLAQVKKDYDLHPRHKIKYDCLYIQRRSLLLNLYLLAKTIPVVLLKKGT